MLFKMQMYLCIQMTTLVELRDHLNVELRSVAKWGRLVLSIAKMK